MEVKESGDPGAQLVLAGDPRQLGPVLRSPLAQKHGLGYSLLERLLTFNALYKKGPDGYNAQFITKLLRNYRYLHPAVPATPTFTPVRPPEAPSAGLRLRGQGTHRLWAPHACFLAVGPD